jgi:hypothetical protein
MVPRPRRDARKPIAATRTAVSAGNNADTRAPACEPTLTGGSGVASACHRAAAAPTTSSAPSGRAVRAKSPAATASRTRAAQAGQTSQSGGGGLQVSTPVTSTGVAPWMRGIVHCDTVCPRSGSAATRGGSSPSLIQWVRWSCHTYRASVDTCTHSGAARSSAVSGSVTRAYRSRLM